MQKFLFRHFLFFYFYFLFFCFLYIYFLGWTQPARPYPQACVTHACYSNNVIKFTSIQCGRIILQSWRDLLGSRETETWWRAGRLVLFSPPLFSSWRSSSLPSPCPLFLYFYGFLRLLWSLSLPPSTVFYFVHFVCVLGTKAKLGALAFCSFLFLVCAFDPLSPGFFFCVLAFFLWFFVPFSVPNLLSFPQFFFL